MHASSKINISSAYRQPIVATDSPQLDSKPHALLGRSQDSDKNNNRPNSLAPASIYYIMQSTAWCHRRVRSGSQPTPPAATTTSPTDPAHTDSEAYTAKAQYHDTQATARNNTVYIMLIRHSCATGSRLASRKTAAINMILKACQPCTQAIIHIAFKQNNSRTQNHSLKLPNPDSRHAVSTLKA